jgi:hypothetical protein
MRYFKNRHAYRRVTFVAVLLTIRNQTANMSQINCMYSHYYSTSFLCDARIGFQRCAVSAGVLVLAPFVGRKAQQTACSALELRAQPVRPAGVRGGQMRSVEQRTEPARRCSNPEL